jgi:hypothetical protein
MNICEFLTPLAGAWHGSNRLWISSEEEPQESASTLTVTFSAQGKVAELRYTWSADDEPEDGLLLLREVRDGVQAMWSDSWHTPDGFMPCSGSLDAQGIIQLRGSYPNPPGPDWGWRIEIDPREGKRLQVRMFNQPPKEEETLAVQVVYLRTGKRNHAE